MGATAQGYVFKNDVIVPVTSVKNQAASGTCWCFATCSFLEAELMRNGKGEHDLSEMFIVRQKLLNQLNDNFLRRGKGNIGQGSLSHISKRVQTGRHSARIGILRHQL
jgi:bleomycin hydrolase